MRVMKGPGGQDRPLQCDSAEGVQRPVVNEVAVIMKPSLKYHAACRGGDAPCRRAVVRLLVAACRCWSVWLLSVVLVVSVSVSLSLFCLLRLAFALG